MILQQALEGALPQYMSKEFRKSRTVDEAVDAYDTEKELQDIKKSGDVLSMRIKNHGNDGNYANIHWSAMINTDLQEGGKIDIAMTIGDTGYRR